MQFGFFPVHVSGWMTAAAGKLLCGKDSLARPLCVRLLMMATANNMANFNMTLLPVIAGHFPDSVSVKQLLHFGQSLSSGRFRQFDYGYTTNMLAYGQATPPDYQLSNVTCPVVIYSAAKDKFATRPDLERLGEALGQRPVTTTVSDPNFNHLDYLWGSNAPDILYPEVMQLIMNN